MSGKSNSSFPLRKLVLCAFFAVLAAITGILESFLPLSVILPLPGVRLGLANLFLAAAFFILGPVCGACAYLIRLLLVFLFVGNPVSLLMSFGGGLFSYASLFLLRRHYPSRFSFCGISALSSAFHAVGQTCAACFFIGTPAFLYLPLLGICCVATGTFTGIIMNFTMSLFRRLTVGKEDAA